MDEETSEPTEANVAHPGTAIDSLSSLSAKGGGGKPCQNVIQPIRKVWNGETLQQVAERGSECCLLTEGPDENVERGDEMNGIKDEEPFPEQEKTKQIKENLDVITQDDTSIKVKTGVGTEDSQRVVEEATACEADFYLSPFIQEMCQEGTFPKTTSCCGDSLVTTQQDRTKIKSPCNNVDTPESNTDAFDQLQNVLDDSILDKPCPGDNRTSEMNNACLMNNTESEAMLYPLFSCNNPQNCPPLESKDSHISRMTSSPELPVGGDLVNKPTMEVPCRTGRALLVKETDTNDNIFLSSDTLNGGFLSAYVDGEDSKPGDADGEGSKPGDTDGEGSKPGDTDGEGSKPGDTDGEGSKPGDTDGEGSKPGDTDGEDSKPGDADGEGSKPGDTDGEGSKPGDTDGEDSKPGDTDGEDSKPGDTDGEDSKPGDTESGNGSLGSMSLSAGVRDHCKVSDESADASENIPKPSDPDIAVGADTLQDNNPKVVTFAEDKEVFDMGYVLPASVTVHLDTPVSSIAPGDVQISTDPVDTNCEASAYPITGILKTDEGVDNRVQTDQDNAGSEDVAVLQHGNTRCSPWYQGDSNLLPSTINFQADLAGHPTPIDHSSPQLGEHKAQLAEATGEEAMHKDAVAFPDQEIHGYQISEVAVETWPERSTMMPTIADTPEDCKDSGEEDDMAGHRDFVIKAVEETDLLYTDNTDTAGGIHSLGTALKPDNTFLGIRAWSPHTPGDAGYHTTDSNYQDTIGPLDNPQFLKTLNYTASQAFDQDEDFVLDTRSFAGLQDSSDLDAGWAWVVLLASFLGATLLGSCVYSAGVLMNPILEEVENDLVKASWIGSVFVCVMSFSGPFVGSVMNKLGARWTVSCAGFVLSLGFLGASLSSTIVQLILTHGVLAGLGAGFTLNPLFVTVGQYFNKYRGFACGVLATGAGAGMLGGGAFVSYLLSIFNLSGTYLVWSGVMLHVIPVGLLLLPSPEERVRQVEKHQAIGDLKHQPDLASMNSGPNSLFGSVNHSMLSGIDRISMGAHGRRVIVPGSLNSKRPSKLPMTSGTLSFECEADTPLLKTMPPNEISRSSHSVNRLIGYNKPAVNRSSIDICGTLTPTTILEGQHWVVPKETTGSISQNRLSFSNSLSQSSHTLNSLVLASTYSRYQNGHQRAGTFGPQSEYTSTSHISARYSQRSGYASTAPRGEMDNESVTSTFVSGLRPYDVINPRHTLESRSISTLIGSVASFPTSLAIVKDDLRRLKPATPYDGSLKGYIISVLDSMRIIRNKPFCIFLSTNFFWALGESPVLIHLPSYVVSRGTTPLQASSLYTSMGIASMAGRFLSGLIASDVNIGPVLMYTGSLGVAGLVVVLSPLMTSTFGQQVGFSFLVGLYTGALVPLTSLITIELLGISELSLGFGLISMAQGLGYLIGPPLSSIVVKEVGFVKAFVSSGFVLIGGSILALCMTLSLSAEDEGNEEFGLDGQENEEWHPFSDLHKVLQKLAGDGSHSDVDGAGQDDECGDNRSEISEKSRLNTGTDESTPVGEDGGKLNLFSTSSSVHSKDSGSGRMREDYVAEGIEENITLIGGDQPSVGDINSGREYSRSTSAALNENTPAPLDTIVEVVGK